MFFTDEYLAHSRQLELRREAEHARLIRCVQRPRPWRRRPARCCH